MSVNVDVSPTDTLVKSDQATTNYASQNYLQLGKGSAGVARTILVFDLAAAGVSGTVSAATLTLTKNFAPDASRTINAHRIERADLSVSQATWNEYKSGSSWATAGGRGSGDSTATGAGSGTMTSGGGGGAGTFTVDLATLAQDAVDARSGVLRVLLFDDDETGNARGDGAYCEVLSQDHATSLYRPVLSVTYTAVIALTQTAGLVSGAGIVGGTLTGLIELHQDWLGTIYSGNFAGGADSWTFPSMTGTGAQSVQGRTGVLGAYAQANTGTHTFRRDGGSPAGKSFEIRWCYFIPAGNANLKKVRVRANDGSAFSGIDTLQTVTGAWTRVTAQSTATGSQTGWRVETYNAANSSGYLGAGSASDDLAYVSMFLAAELDTASVQSVRSGAGIGAGGDVAHTVGPSEIASLEGFETPTVYGADPALEEAGGIGSAEGFETAALTELAAFVWVEDGEGVGSFEAFGSDGTIHAAGTAMPSEIGSLEAFGEDGAIGNGVPPRGDGAIAPVTGAAALLTDAEAAALAGVSETVVRCFTLGIPYHALERDLDRVADALAVDRQRARAGFARAKAARWARGRGNGSYGFLRASREGLLRPAGIGSSEAFETPGAS